MSNLSKSVFCLLHVTSCCTINYFLRIPVVVFESTDLIVLDCLRVYARVAVVCLVWGVWSGGRALHGLGYSPAAHRIVSNGFNCGWTPYFHPVISVCLPFRFILFSSTSVFCYNEITRFVCLHCSNELFDQHQKLYFLAQWIFNKV